LSSGRLSAAGKGCNAPTALSISKFDFEVGNALRLFLLW
jgi:hypothetical protein